MLNKNTGDLLKQKPFRPINEYPMLFWENGEAYWESNFNNNDNTYVSEHYYFINESELYIQKNKGYIIRKITHNIFNQPILSIEGKPTCKYLIWDNKDTTLDDKYKFREINLPDNYLNDNCIEFKYVVDYSNHVDNTFNILKEQEDKPIVKLNDNPFNGTWGDTEYENNTEYESNTEFNEYVTTKIEEYVLKHKDSMDSDMMNVMLTHMCNCLYS